MEDIGTDMYYSWQRMRSVQPETESLVIANQDQPLQPRLMETIIYSTFDDGKCRICKTYVKSLQHIMASSPILSERDYMNRNIKLCSAIHPLFYLPTPLLKSYN